ARTEVVDRGDESAVAVVLKNARQVSLVDQVLGLGDLEGDALDGEVEARGGGEGRADAGGRLVDRIGKEVDAESAGDAESRCELDGLGAARLVKSVAVGLSDLVENARGS